MTQHEIILEFILQANKAAGPVSFGQRSGPNGYTKVWGPKARQCEISTCHISIEHKYPAVSFSEPLASKVGAMPRRDWSCGPNPGRFQHDILFEEADARYGSAREFVAALVKVARDIKVW